MEGFVFDYQGRILCEALINELMNLRRLNRRRLEEMIRAHETETLRYQMVRRQLYIVRELLIVGREPYSVDGLVRIYELGYHYGELYAIGDPENI